jgi:ribosomal protein S18 acetylase RimI-like enzyme
MGDMQFRTRRGEPDDWPVYRDIRLRMLRESPNAYGSSYAYEVGFAEPQWRQRAGNPLLFLAVDERDEVVGTAAGLTETDGTVQVVAMYVSPEARGQGCAEQLLDAVALAARQRGSSRLVLHVTAGNRAASRCYARYGFTPTGRTWPMERKPELTEVELALALG